MTPKGPGDRGEGSQDLMSGDVPETPQSPKTPHGPEAPQSPQAPQGTASAADRTQAPDRDDWRTTFRLDIPSSARIRDYFVGGKDNYPADRQVAQQIASCLPNIREAARINRAFMRRAVRYLVNEAGIRQLIDIGTGLPTMGNVHEVAMAANPAARVVYVDHDPVVLAHARNTLPGTPGGPVPERPSDCYYYALVARKP